jgi:hypothetical protein
MSRYHLSDQDAVASALPLFSEEVAKLYEGGKSLSQLAEIFSASRSTITRWLKQTGTPCRPKNGPKPHIVVACEICSKEIRVLPSAATRKRFCSRACKHADTGKRAIGNRYRAGIAPSNKGQPGHPAWNKGLKGIHLSPSSEFRKGHRNCRAVSVGTERRRTDKAGKPRVWLKIAEPNVWRHRAQIVWERANGSIPRGFLVHHENRDTTDDSLGNLSLQSRANHINEHREDLEAARAIHGIARKSA